MKQILLKKLTVAALFFAALPSALLAQNDNEPAKDKKKHQQIIISRTGDVDDKTVIEITGNKVKVNGKDVADLKDIHVSVNTSTDVNGLNIRSLPRTAFSMNFNNDWNAMFEEDANKAMLGVITNADDKGVKIESVTKESGADKAGLKKEDIITKIDTKKVEATDDVTEIIQSHKPGDKVTVTYLRDGKEQKTTAELGKWKGMKRTITGRGFQPFVSPSAPGGLDGQMNQLNEAQRGLRDRNNLLNEAMPRLGYTFFDNRPRMGLSVQDTDDGKGVKVLDTDEEGNAAKAGIKENDIITQVDGKTVNGADEIARLIKEKKDQNTVKFQIIRDGKTQTIDVKVPRKVKTVDL